MILETKKDGTWVAKIGRKIWELKLLSSNGKERNFETTCMENGIVKSRFEIIQEDNIFFVKNRVDETILKNFLPVLKLLAEMANMEKKSN